MEIPGRVEASLTLPLSKSLAARYAVISSLSGMPSAFPAGACDDVEAILRVVSSAGGDVCVGASGTALRFGIACLSLRKGVFRIDGTGRIRQRPVDGIVDAMRQLGARIDYEDREGFPPVTVHGGHVHGGYARVDGSHSSQFVSALLMTGPVLHDGLTVEVTGGVSSRPYIDMTVGLMRRCGAVVDCLPGDVYRVHPVPYSPCSYTPEADWTAASYWFETAALCRGARIVLHGLEQDSLQGDACLMRMFSALGVESRFSDGRLILSHTGRCAARFDYDFSSCPDLAQTLAVTCACLGLPFRCSGLHSLVIKETDRIHALVTELRRLGYAVTTDGSSFIEWQGEKLPVQQSGAVRIETYGDHRMAMAFAPAAAVHKGLVIADAEVVAKSYPSFWADMEAAGARLVRK